MTKRYLAVIGIAAVLGPVCLYAAEATPPATQVKAATTEAKATPANAATSATETKAAATATEGAVAEGTAKPAKPVYCQGSGRIRVRADSKNGCSSAQQPYRSYSKQQIDETGRIDVAEALETIDPIFHPN